MLSPTQSQAILSSVACYNLAYYGRTPFLQSRWLSLANTRQKTQRSLAYIIPHKVRLHNRHHPCTPEPGAHEPPVPLLLFRAAILKMPVGKFKDIGKASKGKSIEEQRCPMLCSKRENLTLYVATSACHAPQTFSRTTLM